MAIGAAIGLSYKFIPQLGIRSELEYLYRIPSSKASFGNGPTIKTQSHTALANIYIDYYVLPELTIYAGGGLGVAVIDNTIYFPGESDVSAQRSRFAAQGGAGIAYTFFNHLVLDLNVRYTHLGQWRYPASDRRGTFSTVEALVSIAYKL